VKASSRTAPHRGIYNPAVAEAEAPSLTLKQRLQLWIISWAGYLAIRLIGPTLRYRVTVEAGGPEGAYLEPAVYAFWHRCVFSATWRYRNKQIAVMTSRSYDGEYIARIISKFGYVPVRGSSSRGAVGALIGMRRVLEEQRSAAFTIDGPRGPRYVAKPGPVLLAAKTGLPLIAFYLAAERAWVLNSWDKFVIPKPFSRVALHMSAPVRVPRDAGEATMDLCHAEMQAALERVRDSAEAEFGHVAP
jgi:lysophospholipid acyltransferase (LPLAT)-like uncharacterized protein